MNECCACQSMNISSYSLFRSFPLTTILTSRTHKSYNDDGYNKNRNKNLVSTIIFLLLMPASSSIYLSIHLSVYLLLIIQCDEEEEKTEEHAAVEEEEEEKRITKEKKRERRRLI
jgi:hypothetical protein